MAAKQERDDDIVSEAKKRYERCESWEADCRKRFVEDMKFANADPENGWQWESTLKQNRVDRKKPCLTINKTRQHNLQIVNDAKQNKPGVNIRPVGDGATYDAAQVFEGIVRHIEYQSNAEQAYDTATMFQVDGGFGYWRVVTDYVSDDSFDQEIYIRRIPDPLSVYLDPDASEADGSDARFGFVYEDMPRQDFEKLYPEFGGEFGAAPLGSSGDMWDTEDTVRVAEYYRKRNKKDRLVTFILPPPYANAGQQIISRLSAMDEEMRAAYEAVKKEPTTQVRDILTDEIEWFKIAGNSIIDRRMWLGKYIPIVRVVGEETVIEGRLDRKGHTRAQKDAQRMMNYWASESTAQVALQTKTPYKAPSEAIEGLETYWGKSNLDEAAVLPYNQYTEDGRQLNAPEREQPPVMASAFIEGMRIAENWLMMTTGQYQSQFGQNENATSGKAINERQRQGDNATYHFIDNLAIAIRFTGKILIDLIPKVYDTERIIRILAKDGTESHVQIAPGAPQAYQGQQQEDQSVAAIFNPNVGRYEVESDIGPGYATRRQEAFNAMTQIASQNPRFMDVAGDLLWKSADFPLADELAERWSRIIPAAVKGTAPDQQTHQLQTQLQQAHDAVAHLQQQLNDKDKDINIKAFDAETKRLTAIGNAGPIVQPDQLQGLIRQSLLEMLTGGSPEAFEAAPAPSAIPQAGMVTQDQPMQPQAA